MPESSPTLAPPAFFTRGDPIRLVAIDLDGTLLRSDKGLTHRNAYAIRRAVRQGVRIVLATARPPRTVREIYAALGLDTLQINYNGALIWDGLKGGAALHTPLPAEVAREVVTLARQIEPTLAVSIETLDRWTTDRVDDDLPTESARFSKPAKVAPLHELLVGPVTKLMLLAPPAKLAPVRAAVVRRFAADVAIMVSDAHLLQVVHPSVEKAAALAWIARRYDIPQHQCMAIGDAPNDAAMLRWAGLGCAVSSGWPETLDAADVIIPANDADGVAHALKQYVLDD